jgi:hypothetical protein
MGIFTGLIISAAIGAGASVYTADKQEEAAEKEAKRLEQAEADRKAEAERIAKETRPEGEALKAVEFGFGNGEVGGSTSDFLVPKGGTALGGTGKSGLGFSV